MPNLLYQQHDAMGKNALQRKRMQHKICCRNDSRAIQVNTKSH